MRTPAAIERDIARTEDQLSALRRELEQDRRIKAEHRAASKYQRQVMLRVLERSFRSKQQGPRRSRADRQPGQRKQHEHEKPDADAPVQMPLHCLSPLPARLRRTCASARPLHHDGRYGIRSAGRHNIADNLSRLQPFRHDCPRRRADWNNILSDLACIITVQLDYRLELAVPTVARAAQNNHAAHIARPAIRRSPDRAFRKYGAMASISATAEQTGQGIAGLSRFGLLGLDLPKSFRGSCMAPFGLAD